LRALQLIAASSIEQISILGGIDGTTYYGTNAAAGVIRIRTKTA
jgi:outer membrane receptor protein involved in Fe transport